MLISQSLKYSKQIRAESRCKAEQGWSDNRVLQLSTVNCQLPFAPVSNLLFLRIKNLSDFVAKSAKVLNPIMALGAGDICAIIFGIYSLIITVLFLGLLFLYIKKVRT